MQSGLQVKSAAEGKGQEFTLNKTYSRKGDLYRVWVEKFGKNMDLLDR